MKWSYVTKTTRRQRHVHEMKRKHSKSMISFSPSCLILFCRCGCKYCRQRLTLLLFAIFVNYKHNSLFVLLMPKWRNKIRSLIFITHTNARANMRKYNPLMRSGICRHTWSALLKLDVCKEILAKLQQWNIFHTGGRCGLCLSLASPLLYPLLSVGFSGFRNITSLHKRNIN